ncbi:MAG: NAD(P)H-binding protein [Candidatus Thalassarchaeaceae archaeon]|jgi:NADH dehydrogenase|nr:NAD(P)H-binding protein [Candidatus Thalassarchaeaceae archaeon]
MSERVHVVTGAFGYSGRWIARELLSRGKKVRTLTNAVGRDDPFHGMVEVMPIDFTNHDLLVSSLRGTDVLYNTYWVRYKNSKDGYAHEVAVENTRKLFLAAEEAGVNRIVHFSVAHPHKAPDWSYFRGKVEVEKLLTESSLSYAILRPTVFFGGERDVLINNMAWLIRKFPVFGIFGMGNYLIQPIHIEDVAKVAVEQGESVEDVVMDVAGPEIFTYREYVTLIAKSLGVRRLIIPVPPIVGWAVGKVVGAILRDRVITRAEIKGLMQGLMATDAKPLGETKFSEWVAINGAALGAKYHNDLKERKYTDPRKSN